MSSSPFVPSMKSIPCCFLLFDLSVDPYEANDLTAEQPQMFRKLKAKLAELSGEAAAPHIAPTSIPKNFEAPKIWGH